MTDYLDINELKPGTLLINEIEPHWPRFVSFVLSAEPNFQGSCLGFSLNLYGDKISLTYDSLMVWTHETEYTEIQY